MCGDSELPVSGPRLTGTRSVDPRLTNPRLTSTRSVDTRPAGSMSAGPKVAGPRATAHQSDVSLPIADESDAQVDPDECPQDTCARVGHEWQAVWDGPWTSWGSRTVTVSYDECARCGATENYWESPLGQ